MMLCWKGLGGHFGSEVDFILFIIVKVVEQHTYRSVHALNMFYSPLTPSGRH